MSKKNVEAFIEAVEKETTYEREELEKRTFERDEIHSARLESTHDFEGQFGMSTVAIFTLSDDRVKSYFNGVERECLNRFIETVELPVDVQFVRVLKESEKNEGRSYGFLYIKTA